MSNGKREQGRVKNYLPARGFGFVVGDNSFNQVFFHISDVENTEMLYEGDILEYRVVNSSKGLSAKDIVVVESGNSQDKVNQ